MYGITLLPAVEEPWVSTNDVLTALLWSAVVWAEDDDNFTSNTDDVSQMKFPVNIRSRWSPRLPDEYLGVAVIQAPVTSPREDLLSLSSGPLITHDTETRNGHILDLEKEKLLAKVSSSIRRALNDIDVKDIRHAIAFTAAVPDVSKISERPRNAVKITSWADQGACEAEWGDVIGRAEAVRFATFSTKVRPIVLPKINSIEGGGLEVFLSLRTKEMARFGASALVERFGCLRTSVSHECGKR
ncbi:hypothetical protein PTT_16765 [Pyrenophora teres f. teres 0-1]|uniref:Uncharacterized protein n=2 Tax=Pyrenophora teres f. teres TaxID=97479 RepID=E3S2Y8_PYRTT|nr:hypothetical protein PTT_16765 [Pyrenophora teres f. teres 0-1]